MVADWPTPLDPRSDPLHLSPWGKGGTQDNHRAGASLCTFGTWPDGSATASLTLNALGELLTLEPNSAAVLLTLCLLKITIKFNKSPSLGISLFSEQLFVSHILKEPT